jgi:hypothetical protein
MTTFNEPIKVKPTYLEPQWIYPVIEKTWEDLNEATAEDLDEATWADLVIGMYAGKFIKPTYTEPSKTSPIFTEPSKE